MKLFGKKKEEEMPQAIIPEETEKISIGIPKEKKTNETIAEYYQTNYAGVTNREQLLNTPTIEVTATQQDLLYSIYSELRKLNKEK